MSQIEFRFEGSAEAADAFGHFLETTLPGTAVDSRNAVASTSGGKKAVDPVAVAALVVSIPAAVLATFDLVDRIRKRTQAKTIVDEAKRLKIEQNLVVFVAIGDESLPLADLGPDALLDMADRSKNPEI